VVFLAGCGDAVLLRVDGDRVVPDELDAICLAVADTNPAGGHFGRSYRLEGELAGLPQSLAVEAGGASSADAWVRGYLGGAEVAFDRAGVDFSGDVTLRVDRCTGGPDGPAVEVSTRDFPVPPAMAVVVGRGGVRVAAAHPEAGLVVDGDGGDLAPGGMLPSSGAIGLVAIDADGDCDDELVAWSADRATLFTSDGADYADGGEIAAFAIRAAAAADVDRDGDQDLVLGGGGELRLYRSDGAGGFSHDAAAIPGGVVSDVTTLALGDLDGDGNPDLIAGQGDAAGAPPRAFLADPSGGGTFAESPAVLPAVDLQVRGLALADADGDADLDLAVALAGAPVRLYINRGGRLEDQSFIRLPQPAPEAAAVAAGDWNGDCFPDLVLAAPAATRLLAGAEDGMFVDDGGVLGAGSAVIADVDDDGDRDLVLGSAGGMTWLRR
jgi:hypothetical protein